MILDYNGLDLSFFEKKIYKLFNLDYNFFVFTAGIITALDVNILTNIISLKVSGNWMYFILNILAFLSSTIVVIYFFKLTVICIDINREASEKKTYDAKNMRFNEIFMENKSLIKKNLLITMIFFIITFCIIISAFFVNNIKKTENVYLYYSNGYIKYIGEVRNNKKNGYGEMYYKEGRLKYKGYWKDGKEDGYGILYSKEGEIIYNGKWYLGDIK